MTENIFTVIGRILVINIQIFIVCGVHRAPLCSVQPAPLSMAGLVGRIPQGSEPPAWTPGRRQEDLSLTWLLGYLRRWSCLGRKEGGREKCRGVCMFKGIVRKHSQELCCLGQGLLTQGPGKELRPQTSFPFDIHYCPMHRDRDTGVLRHLQVPGARFREPPVFL